MASDRWTQTTLGAIADKHGYGLVDGPFGSNLPASAYTDTGVPVIRGSNLSLEESRFDDSGFVFVSEEMAQRLSRSLCRAGDIVFTKKGTLGQTGFVPDHPQYQWFLLSSNQMKLTVDRRLADPLFVYYYVSSPQAREKIIRDSETTGVPKTNTTYLREFPIPLPPLPEQRAIAHILGALDDKIELNRQMNQTLEDIARALFKSWFVDFDPVRAKTAGQQPPGLALHIADLFPDEFVESELGEIPKGWEVDSILRISELLSGGTPSTRVSEYWDGDIKWVSARDVSGAQGTFLLDTERVITQKGVDNSSTKILPELTTIVTARGTVGSYCILDKPMAINQTNYGLKAKSEDADYFVFFALANLVSQLKQRAYGTIFDTVTTRTFETSEIVVPEDAVIIRFEQHARPLMEKIRRNLRQSRTLAALRDTLLPELISGKLRVPEDLIALSEQTNGR